jgi:hypothetical protein
MPATRNFVTDPSWVLFEVDPQIQSFYAAAGDPVEEAIIAELELRMQAEPLVLLRDRSSYLLTPENYHGNDVALFFGLDNLVEWKLSKEFARKYPFLDCSTGKLH